MQHSAGDLIDRAHDALAKGEGSIQLEPTARLAEPGDITEARIALYTIPETLIERFDAGVLARIDAENGDVIIFLATANPPRAAGVPQRVTALRCDDPVDADHQYAHIAGILGLLPESCTGCGTAISAVFQVCPDCA